MNALVIALGYKELNSTPKVLYTGNDVDAAKKAISVAGEKGQIFEGKVIKDPMCIHRERFDQVTV